MKKIKYSLLALAALFVAGDAYAENKSAIYLPDGMVTRIDPHAYGTQTFYCNSRTYFSDVVLPKFHGCETELMAFGREDKKQQATILTVFYDWQKNAEDKNEPKTKTFIELPNQTLYRVENMNFLTSPQIQSLFDDIVGWGRTGGAKTNITMDRFIDRRLDTYADMFCAKFTLKFPFYGQFGWCQNDRLLSGKGNYVGKNMTYTQAVIALQSYILDNNIRIQGDAFVPNILMTALNADKDGWLYYAFAVPGQMTPEKYQPYYLFRVYFNGRIEMRETRELPEALSKL